MLPYLLNVGLISGFREFKTDALCIDVKELRFYGYEGGFIGNDKVLELKRSKNLGQPIGSDPGAVQAIPQTGLRLHWAGNDPVIFFMFEVKEDGLTLEVNAIELIDQVAFADRVFSSSPFLLFIGLKG